MKLARITILLVLLAFVSNCDSTRHVSEDTRTKPAYDSAKQTSAGDSTATGVAQQRAEAPYARSQEPVTQQVSLKQADQSLSMAEAMDRKIIRDADLALEVGAPTEVQRKITSIAELLGGFVVTSESKQRQIGDAKQELEVNLVVRVPATQFGVDLDQFATRAIA
jgi:hypothetical protein